MPDGSSFSITYGQAEDAHQILVQATNSISQQIDELKSRVDQVIQNIEGDMALSYHAEHVKWMQKVNEMGNTLTTGAATLRDSATEYQQTDRAEGSRWESVGG
ncbi:WXG100 family type VII secretion target [Streptomyces sp. AK02-01A]|uniref:WXG100 family type VII secretion target n=1 Tax=Streptomyces sp. AK02-01A TaxID=3028648 RepID=UPI0029B2DEBB|nr:WXG100 family type VII secretion target [Streptomyces sp. AK02-01A]MDX3849468.1 WXG100 family type VII secretion target [Streptomyces sp. AK02-01A]